tara:strand:+ start:115 stop:372 length:258 start_codon:yes stop_codon:yes gene_type:complete
MSNSDSWKHLADKKIDSINSKFKIIYIFLATSILINIFLFFSIQNLESESEITLIEDIYLKIDDIERRLNFIGTRSYEHINSNHP